MRGHRIRILLVEGAAADRAATIRSLRQLPLANELRVAATGDEALAELRSSPFDVVLIETPLPNDPEPLPEGAAPPKGESPRPPVPALALTDSGPLRRLAPHLGDATPILLAADRDAPHATSCLHPDTWLCLVKRSDRRHLDAIPSAVARAMALRRCHRWVRQTYRDLLAICDDGGAGTGEDSRGELPWRALLVGLPQALLVLDPSAQVTFANRAAEQLLGYDGEELVGQSVERFVTPCHRGRMGLAPGGEGDSGGGEVPRETSLEVGLQRKGGEQFRADLRCCRLDGEGGGRTLVTLARTGGRAQVQQRLIRQVLELQRANTQLADFAHTVCHDLKAPLRAIHNLVARVEEELDPPRRAAPSESIRRLRDRVQGLDRLLDNLLKYALVGSMRSGREWVDCNGLLREIVDLLGIPATFPVVARRELPRFETARTPLAQVLRNLIENAVKHHHRPAGRIEVDARDRGDFYEFSVGDDGPGIPREYRDRVLQPSWTQDAKGGRSAMGLAIVRKIVSQQGRRVRIATPPAGAGTTVLFEWNKRWSLRGDPSR